MKNRKASIFAVVVLALSLALSPVYAYAEELDTPVYEDPIDELQSDSDSITGHYSFAVNDVSVAFDVFANCSFEWTEGISGRFTMVYLSAINLTVDNTPKSLEWLTVPQISSYDLGQVAVRKFRVAINSNEYVYFMVKVYVDEYGVLSTYAQTY